MKTVVFPSVGFQSYCSRSSFEERDAEREPGKTQTVGLCCAALGIDRGDRDGIAKIASLKMGVRIDVEPVIKRDYLTAGAKGAFPVTMSCRQRKSGGKLVFSEYHGCRPSGAIKLETSISKKDFLCDAFFWTALEGDDKIVESVYEALGNPIFGLSLGRKCFKPFLPMKIKNGLTSARIEDALSSCFWLPSYLEGIFDLQYKWTWLERTRKRASSGLRAVIETDRNDPLARKTFDIPVSFVQEDRATVMRGMRYVKDCILSFPQETKS